MLTVCLKDVRSEKASIMLYCFLDDYNLFICLYNICLQKFIVGVNSWNFYCVNFIKICFNEMAVVKKKCIKAANPVFCCYQLDLTFCYRSVSLGSLSEGKKLQFSSRV